MRIAVYIHIDVLMHLAISSSVCMRACAESQSNSFNDIKCYASGASCAGTRAEAPVRKMRTMDGLSICIYV